MINAFRLLAFMLVMGSVGTAHCAEIDFTHRANPDEAKVVARDARKDVDAAARAGMAVEVWVGQQGEFTAFRLLSPAVCGSGLGGEGAMSSCPSLVYRDGFDRPPVWRGMAGEMLEWPPGVDSLMRDDGSTRSQ